MGAQAAFTILSAILLLLPTLDVSWHERTYSDTNHEDICYAAASLRMNVGVCTWEPTRSTQAACGSPPPLLTYRLVDPSMVELTFWLTEASISDVIFWLCSYQNSDSPRDYNL